MTQVSVNRSVLEWALDRSGRADVVRQKFPKLSQWLDGQTQPTLRQLEEFAKTTYTPLGYLFLTEPPREPLPIPYFRTITEESQRLPSQDLVEIVRTMKQRQTWMHEYLREQGYEVLKFVRSVGIRDDPEVIAESIRKTLKLPYGWAKQQSTWTEALKKLQAKIEEAGIVVTVNGVVGNNNHRKLDPEDFRGFVLVDEFAPFVFVNGADGKAAQMFTLAHELAHIWLGSSAAFDLRELQPARDEIEQMCNKIAAELLVPTVELSEFWPSIRQVPGYFQEIARQFKVSELVAARRALDLKLISRKEFINFYHLFRGKEHRIAKSEPGGDFYATQNFRIGRLFAGTVVRAVREGRLLYREAYHLTGLYGNTFEKYTKQLLGEHP